MPQQHHERKSHSTSQHMSLYLLLIVIICYLIKYLVSITNCLKCYILPNMYENRVATFSTSSFPHTTPNKQNKKMHFCSFILRSRQILHYYKNKYTVNVLQFNSLGNILTPLK